MVEAVDPSNIAEQLFNATTVSIIPAIEQGADASLLMDLDLNWNVDNYEPVDHDAFNFYESFRPWQDELQLPDLGLSDLEQAAFISQQHELDVESCTTPNDAIIAHDLASNISTALPSDEQKDLSSCGLLQHAQLDRVGGLTVTQPAMNGVLGSSKDHGRIEYPQVVVATEQIEEYLCQYPAYMEPVPGNEYIYEISREGDMALNHGRRAQPPMLEQESPFQSNEARKAGHALLSPSVKVRAKNGRGRHRRQLPLSSVTILDDWYVANQNYPYPSSWKKAKLAKDASLSVKQVETWLSNARRRRADPNAGLGPFDYWLSSSSEDEGANITDIARASAPLLVNPFRNSPSTLSSYKRDYDSMSLASSMSSRGSAFDTCPEARYQPPAKRGRKKYAQMAFSRDGSMSSACSVGSNSNTFFGGDKRVSNFGSFPQFDFGSSEVARKVETDLHNLKAIGSPLNSRSLESRLVGSPLPSSPPTVPLTPNVDPSNIDRGSVLCPRDLTISRISSTIKKEQLLHVMENLGLTPPSTLNYELDNGVFLGVAHARFATISDAVNAKEALYGYRVNRSMLSVHHAVRGTMPNDDASSEDHDAASNGINRESLLERTQSQMTYHDHYRCGFTSCTFSSHYRQVVEHHIRGHAPTNKTDDDDVSSDEILDQPQAITDGMPNSDQSLHPETHQEGRAQTRSGAIAATVQPSVVKQKVKYQCTFCGILLSSKSWKRHEETTHLPQRQWTCMPHSDFRVADSLSNCVFCGLIIDDDYWSHATVCKHRIDDCLRRSHDERTFGRKDKLAQHIKNFHGCSIHSTVVDAWESTPTRLTRELNCGFCGKKETNWNARCKHIAAHFREGKDMTMWNWVY